MKLPNGYGSIAKLSGNRRKPFIVRITKGYDDNGKQQREILGYYETKKKALEALSNYNDNPYDIESSKLTFSELYEKWSAEKYAEISKSAVRTYKAAYSYCEPLYDKMLTEIRTSMLQDVVDYADVGATTRARIHSLFRLMFKYAMKCDFIKKDYSEFVTRPKISVEKERRPFTEEEISHLWQISENHYAKIILILIYTGWRPTELSKMTFKDGIDTDEMIMTGGIKTEAGKNRVVPVCKKIEPFIMHMYNKGYEAVSVDEKGEMLNYDKLYRRLKTFLSDYEFDHIPYECRHTFATMLDNNDTNPKIKKLLLGHSSNDVTEKVYTHKTIEQLREAVDKL